MPLWLLFCNLPPTLWPSPQCHLLRHMARPGHAVRAWHTALGMFRLQCTTTHRRKPCPSQAAQLLRMTHVWAQTTVAVQETTSGLGLLCRLYLCIAWGLLQPWFLCLALLLCRKAIKYDCGVYLPPQSHRWVPYYTVCSLVSGALPVACHAPGALPPAPPPSAPNPNPKKHHQKALRGSSLLLNAAAMLHTAVQNLLHRTYAYCHADTLWG